MSANDCKCEVPYLNKLVDQYNNTTCHYSIIKKRINVDYLFQLKTLSQTLKLLKLK